MKDNKNHGSLISQGSGSVSDIRIGFAQVVNIISSQSANDHLDNFLRQSHSTVR